MSRTIGLTSLVALLVALLAVPAAAIDNVTRKREKNLTGEVSAVSKTEVSVKVKTPKEDTIKVAANDVESIAWTGEPPEFNLARGDEKGGRFARAIEGYTKSLAANKASNPLVKTDLEYVIARTTAKIALSDASKIDEAIKKLEDFRSKNGEHYRYYEAVGFLGQLYMAKKDFIKAQTAFDQLGKAPWKETQMASRINSGKLAQADNKTEDALKAFDEVIAMKAEGPQEESQRQEAMLGKSRILVVQKSYDEALKLLDEVIAKAAAEDAKVQAEAYIRQGDCLREQGKDNDALLAYLHVDVLFPSEKLLHAEALFHLSRLWEKVGQKGRATETRERLETEFPNSDWTKQLKAPAAG